MRWQGRTFTKVALIAVGTLGLAVLLVACQHVERGVVYRNETDSAVTLVFNGLRGPTLQPGDAKELREKQDLLPYRIQAYTKDGELIFDETVTWEDLEARNFEIVITGRGGSPLTPSPTPMRSASPDP